MVAFLIRKQDEDLCFDDRYFKDRIDAFYVHLKSLATGCTLQLI